MNESLHARIGNLKLGNEFQDIKMQSLKSDKVQFFVNLKLFVLLFWKNYDYKMRINLETKES